MTKTIPKQFLAIFLLVFNTSPSLAQAPKLMLPIGHAQSIDAISYSPNGKLVLTGSYDNTAKLWDASSGKLLRSFDHYTNIVTAAVFSKTGKYFAVADFDGRVEVRNSLTADIVAEFKLNGVQSIVFNKDDRYLLVGSADYTATLLDIAGERIAAVIKDHSGAIIKAFFSPDETKIITASDDQSIKVYDIAKGENILSLSTGNAEINEIQKAGNTNLYVTSCSDNLVRIWDINKGILVNTIKPHDSKLTTFCLSDDGKTFCTGASNGSIKEWYTASGGFRGVVLPSGEGVSGMGITKDSRYVIASLDDRVVEAIDLQTQKIVWSNDTLNWPAKLITNSPDGRYVTVTGGFNKDAISWNAKTGKLNQRLTGHTRNITSAMYSGNSQYVLFSSEDNTAKLLDIKKGAVSLELKGHEDQVSVAAFSKDESKIITASYDETVKVWDRNSGKLINTLKANNSLITFAAITPDGKFILATYFDSTINIWDATTGRFAGTLGKQPEMPMFLSFSPDSKLVLTSLEKEGIGFWDIISRRKLAPFLLPEHRVRFASFAPSGKYIAYSALYAGRALPEKDAFTIVGIMDAISHKEISRLIISNNSYKNVVAEKICFNNKGDRIAVILSDHSIQLWDIKTNSIVKKFIGHASKVNTIAFSDDDRFLVSASADHTFKTWDVATGSEIATYFMVDNNDGFVQLPTGFYKCSPNAAALLHYVKGMQTIGFEQLDIKYNRPDKVLEAINSADTIMIHAYRNAYHKRIQKLGIDTTSFRDGYSIPVASILKSEEIKNEQTTPALMLKIAGMDSTYLLDKFNVWVNDVPVFGLGGINIRQRKRKSFDTTLTITLSQGENRIATSVINVNGTESYRSPVIVKYLPSSPKPEKVVFIGIGINRFADSKYNLQWSVKDIRDLAFKLKQKYGERISIDTLFDEKVTRENVLALKQKLQTLTEDDKVILGYSGHGLLSKDFDYYLSTFNVNFDKPEINGLPYDDLESLVDKIRPRKKLVLIDACNSGEVDKAELLKMEQSKASLVSNGVSSSKGIIFRVPDKNSLGLANSFELMQELFVNVGKGTGATIISAAAGTQFALERNDLQNGVFTYSILEALNNNSQLKVSALKRIVGERVVQLTNGMQKPTSRNETKNFDWEL